MAMSVSVLVRLEMHDDLMSSLTWLPPSTLPVALLQDSAPTPAQGWTEALSFECLLTPVEFDKQTVGCRPLSDLVLRAAESPSGSKRSN
jgi:hypothetical protein